MFVDPIVLHHCQHLCCLFTFNLLVMILSLDTYLSVQSLSMMQPNMTACRKFREIYGLFHICFLTEKAKVHVKVAE